MAVRLLLRERRILGEGRFADIVIWQLPSPVPGSTHGFKYRLAFVVEGVCVLRFDNETGKSDHKHIGTEEVPHTFTSLVQLVTDFWNAIDEWSSP
ncbi:MAG: toxin-antitoxin system TumE family protein [Stellaceae bacterium]